MRPSSGSSGSRGSSGGIRLGLRKKIQPFLHDEDHSISLSRMHNRINVMLAGSDIRITNTINPSSHPNCCEVLQKQANDIFTAKSQPH